MKKKVYLFWHRYYLVIISTVILSVLPFFWINPGEMDLGGDGTRLYFYDPLSFLKSYNLYGISPLGFGNVEPHYDMIPFVSLLVLLQSIFHSSYLLITFSNIIKFAGGFIFVYLIIKLLEKSTLKNSLQREVSAILGGLFYIFIYPIQGNYERALNTHDQIFLNPLFFYLFLQYGLTRERKYLWIFLFISFIFAHNFSWVAAPALFSFYPLAFCALFIYIQLILKKRFPWKGYSISFLVFLGLHAFDFIPTVANILSGAIGSRVFYSDSMTQLLDYVSSVLANSKLIDNLLVSPPGFVFQIISFVFPAILILGVLLNRKNKTILLFGLIFLIAFFFVTGNITHTGAVFYKKLFYLPGFSMFRDFRGKWFMSYAFYYSVFFGLSLYSISLALNKRFVLFFSSLLVIVLIIFGLPLIQGHVVKRVLFQANNVMNTTTFNKNYITTFDYIKSLPKDGKILSLPFTDYDYQVIYGLNNGAYVGVSPFPYLNRKETFSGYGDMIPLSDIFYSFSKSKNYEGIKNLLSILNVRYIYYDSNTNIYDSNFPQYPYQYVRDYLPATQKEYRKYINNLGVNLIYKNSSYQIYEKKSKYLPQIYGGQKIVPFDNITKTKNSLERNISKDMNSNTIYMQLKDCIKILHDSSCQNFEHITNKQPIVHFQKISPTQYSINISNMHGKFPLVFSEAFSKKWHIVKADTKNNFISEFVNKPALFSSTHFVANGYANGWIIDSAMFNNKSNITLTLEMVDQKLFYISCVLTIIVICGFLISTPYWFKKS